MLEPVILDGGEAEVEPLQVGQALEVNQPGAGDGRAGKLQAPQVGLAGEHLQPVIGNALREFPGNRFLVSVGAFVQLDLDDAAKRLQPLVANQGAQPVGSLDLEDRFASQSFDLSKQDTVYGVAHGRLLPDGKEFFHIGAHLRVGQSGDERAHMLHRGSVRFPVLDHGLSGEPGDLGEGC